MPLAASGATARPTRIRGTGRRPERAAVRGTRPEVSNCKVVGPIASGRGRSLPAKVGPTGLCMSMAGGSLRGVNFPGRLEALPIDLPQKIDWTCGG